MKQNKILRVSAVLLVLTLLSTCVISGTFAKYTTSASAEDNARVAKWGVEVAATADDAFTANDDDTVISLNGVDNVIAPGTDGKLCALAISGQPEVSGTITATVDLTLENWLVDGAYYCPLVITVAGTDYVGTSYASAADFEKDVEDAIVAAIAGDFDALTDLSKDVDVTWKWAFEGNDDVKDTALGKASTPASIAISATVTVTQVD